MHEEYPTFHELLANFPKQTWLQSLTSLRKYLATLASVSGNRSATTYLANSTHTRVFVLQNTGKMPISVNRITLEGKPAGIFVVDSETSFTLR